MNRPFEAVIYDFDGVIADSEVGANHALAECLSELGSPTTFEDSLRYYYGHNWRETERRIGKRLYRSVPSDLRERVRERTRLRFEQDFAPVPGVVEFLANCALPMAVASSSRVEYLQWALSRLGLAEHFGVHLYSAEGMARGKPHPDIYLRAARGRGIAAERCLTIEARRSAPAPPSPRE